MAVPGAKFYYCDQGDCWNELEITAQDTLLRVVLNGVVVTHYDGQGVLNDAVHREHRVGMRGIIALQIHRGDELRIR
jgi:hypothetical protein